MKIALFSGNYNYQADGANKALNRLVGYMEAQGHEMLVFSPTAKRPAFEPTGTLISVPSLPIPFRPEYRLARGLTPALKARIRDFAPDFFHLSAPDRLGHSALNFAETLGIPAVASFHTRFDTYLDYYKLGFLSSYARRLMAKFYARCAHVYVPSPSMANVLQDEGLIGDNLRFWGRGITREKFDPALRDMEWRRRIGIADDEIALAFVGRLVKEKGLDIYVALIKAALEAGLPVKPIVIGDGPERGWVEKNLPASIPTDLLLGHVSGAELARAYASADIFINPSRTETFGNVTLEAMASGLPALCLSATGSIDLIKDGHTGYIIEGTPIENWLEKIRQLCNQADQRKAMGLAAWQASQAYDWSAIFSELEAHYKEVLSIAKARRETALSA